MQSTKDLGFVALQGSKLITSTMIRDFFNKFQKHVEIVIHIFRNIHIYRFDLSTFRSVLFFVKW